MSDDLIDPNRITDPWFMEFCSGDYVTISNQEDVIICTLNTEDPDQVQWNGELIMAAPKFLVIAEAMIRTLSKGTPIYPHSLLARDLEKVLNRVRGEEQADAEITF